MNYVSSADAMRFVNWLHNGQPIGDQDVTSTEDGVYSTFTFATRAADAQFFIPTESEWYKAAYHVSVRSPDGNVDHYYDFPISSFAPNEATANATGDISNPGRNVANYLAGADWNGQDGNVTTVGSAGPLSESFYGTSDQDGNVREWTETFVNGPCCPVIRGGSVHNPAIYAKSDFRTVPLQSIEAYSLGFRVASPSLCQASSQPGLAEIVTSTGTTVSLRTARMLGVRSSSADPGQRQAIRITAIDVAPPFHVWNGKSMWVGQPREFSELPGRGYSSPGALDSEDTFISSVLRCDPVYTDWTLLGDRTIWIRGKFIVPGTIQPGGGGLSVTSTYAIQMVDENCLRTDPGSFGMPTPITTAGYGDIAELSAGEARAVNDTIGVEEFLLVAQKFSGAGGVPGTGGLPIKARVDMVGVTNTLVPVLDGVISNQDIVAVIDAFGGGAYPFVPVSGLVCP